MQKKIVIMIFGETTDISREQYWTNLYFGNRFSSTSTINVNKTNEENTVSILYRSNMFKKLDPEKFIENIYNLFDQSFPSDQKIFSIQQYIPRAEQDAELKETLTNIYLSFNKRNIKSNQTYNQNLTETKIDAVNDTKNPDTNINDSIFSLWENISDEIKDPIKKKERSINKSFIFKNSKNSKREIHRHGVIISHDKNDLEKDYKTLKSILNEFIPGKSDYIRKFRKDILLRWIKAYSISKKELFKLEKNYKKEINLSKGIDNKKALLNIAKAIFNKPASDKWNDPNR